MNKTDIRNDVLDYYFEIKQQQRNKEAFDVHPIRAVLIETKDEARARRLMQLVHHPLVAGPSKRAGLFWFTISGMLDEVVAATSSRRALPYYLDRPQIILD